METSPLRSRRPKSARRRIIVQGIRLHLSSGDLTPDKSCRLRRSTQHSPEVYSQESRILKSFWDVDSSAAKPGRAALANTQTGRCLGESIVGAADWCFRWFRAARDSADRKSRPAHP